MNIKGKHKNDGCKVNCPLLMEFYRSQRAISKLYVFEKKKKAKNCCTYNINFVQCLTIKMFAFASMIV